MLKVIPKYKFSEPRRNLPGRKGVATKEDRFTIAFARAYQDQFQSIHSSSEKTKVAVAREIPVNGYGIADLVTVAWSPDLDHALPLDNLIKDGQIISRAFECKLKDWRAALAQAGRYRFFAYQAIVLLPEESCRVALKFLETFRLTRIGLWSFDQMSGRISRHYTPRPMKPKSTKYFHLSLQMVHQATRGALPIL